MLRTGHKARNDKHDKFRVATRPEPDLYASGNSVCAGIVARAALFSEGGWDAFSKTPTASNPVICFRVELHLGAEPTRHNGADSLTAKDLSSPCGGRCSRRERWGERKLKKVTGIGGFFFRAQDPKALRLWYQQHLGVSLIPTSYEDSVWQQDAGPTVFDPQPETSDFFKGTDKIWMLNFRVRDLDKMAAQLRAAGIAVEIEPAVLSQRPVRQPA
jgi:hypothetical protein